MEPTLIQTKLHAPAPEPETVPRERLLDHLSAADRSRLILVAAPAGSGKTTLIASWLAELDRPSGWLSIDDEDDDPHQFLAYVIASLRGLRGNLGNRAFSLLQLAPPPSPEDIAGVLINELAENMDRGILVLDDYHVIRNAATHRLVDYLIKRLPPSITVVIISRSDPPLALARLRARGELCEIRASDLRFRTEEASVFMERVCGCALETDTIAALTQRVEGWAVGLQLAGLAIRQSPDPATFVARFAGTHEWIADYLTDEVLAGLTSEQQDFLVRTSILRRLSAPLCKAVTGSENAGEMLEQLSRANLFLIPLDESRTWFRYHHLFAELLRRRCRERFGGQYTELLMRASRWAEEANLWDEAVAYARDAGDTDRVADLAARYGIQALSLGMVGKVLRWLDLLPPDVVHSSPDLCIITAWSSNLLQELDRLATFTRIAERLLADGRRPHPGVAMIDSHLALLSVGTSFLEGAAPEEVEEPLLAACAAIPDEGVLLRSIGEIMLAHSYVLRGKFVASKAAYHRARRSSMAAKSALMELLTSIGEAEACYFSGDLEQSAHICRETLDHVRENIDDVMSGEVGVLYATEALAQYERNEIDASETSLNRAMRILETISGSNGTSSSISALVRTPPTILQSNATGIFLTLYAQVRMLICRGKFSEAEGLLGAAGTHMHPSAGTVGQVIIDALRMRLWMVQRDHGAIRDWRRTSGTAGENTRSAFWGQMSGLTHARAAFAVGEHEESYAALNDVLGDMGATGTVPLLIEGLILKSLVCHASSRYTEASACLKQALELSHARGFIRIWLDEGSRVLPLLQTFVSTDGANGAPTRRFAAELIRLLLQEESSRASSHAEGLSERELEVLRLMAAGHVNREIADRLFIAVGTVKKHSHTIFQKLDVRNRTEAVRRAQELRLI